MNSDKNSSSELVSAIRPLVRELAQIKKQAEALGLFTNDRELLECTGCEFPLPTEKRESSTPELHNSGRAIITKLSFTHLAELIAIEDNLKRVFYEIECMCGNWSVRELKHQIASLYYERSGLSKDKKKLAELVQSGTEKAGGKTCVVQNGIQMMSAG